MNKRQYEQLQKYQREKQVFSQMNLEQNIRGLMHQIVKYQITDATVPFSLIFELESLLHRLNSLVQQLKNV